MKRVADCRFETEIRGEAVRVRCPGLRCAACGFETLELGTMDALAARAADEYRRQHGLLRSDEIRARRKSLGLTQEAFARWLRVGVASVRRWELGGVQDCAMDELMRLKTDQAAASGVATEIRRLLRSARAGSSFGARGPQRRRERA
jgi:putative zinc finger/helix-turn-helix YgiT family protein